MGKLSALPGMGCTKYDEREKFPNPFRRRFVLLLTFDLHVCIQIGNEAFFLLHNLQFHSLRRVLSTGLIESTFGLHWEEAQDVWMKLQVGAPSPLPSKTIHAEILPRP